jgi:hypothetical protein
MTPKRLYFLIGLTLAFMCASAGLAGAGLLNSASQMVSLTTATSNNTYPTNTLQRVNADGSFQNPFVLPSGYTYAITKIWWRFHPSGSVVGPLQLRLGLFYGKMGSIDAYGVWSANDNIISGLPISASAWNGGSYSFTVVDLGNGNVTVPGFLGIRVVGFITNQ